jgi:hypothetical protein
MLCHSNDPLDKIRGIVAMMGDALSDPVVTNGRKIDQARPPSPIQHFSQALVSMLSLVVIVGADQAIENLTNGQRPCLIKSFTVPATSSIGTVTAIE